MTINKDVIYLKDHGYECENDEFNNSFNNKVDPSDPNTIPKFVDEVPKPHVLKPTAILGGIEYYEISMKQSIHYFHKYFPCSIIWGYNGCYPGPMLKVFKDQTILVKWINKLPYKHFLPVDITLHGAMDSPEVRTCL